MNEQEVERIANVIHQAFCDHRREVEQNPADLCPYSELSDHIKDRYRACARAVLADLYRLAESA